jgi:Domain of unknown function (DUF222)
VPAAAAAPGRRPAPDIAPALLADDSWWGDDPEPPPVWLADEPGLGPSWLADDPGLAEYPWWADDLAEAGPGRPGPVEVWKAGRWDRSRGDGGGFAAGGLGDRLPPGPVLAGLAGDRWAAGLGKLSDDELIGILRAARRLTSWAAAMELAAVGDLWSRRTAEEDAGDAGAALFADDEIAAALTLTRHAANQVLDLAVALGRLPLTAAALTAGDIDLPRAEVIADEVTGLTAEHAAAVERAIIGAAPAQTTGQVRAAAHRAVLAADPAAARKRKEEALRQARVERWAEPAGTAALAGRDLPPAAVLAADAHLSALAAQLKTTGVPGTMDALRAQIYLALLTGAPVASLLPAGADWPGSPGSGGGDGDGGRGGPAAPPGPVVSGLSPGCVPPGLMPPGFAPDAGPPTAAASGVPPLAGLPGPVSSFGHLTGSVNLTVPLATWLGLAGAPGHAAGYGPLDATDCRAVAAALATQASTQWCLTITGPDGRAVGHGCARAGPSPGRARAGPAARPPGKSETRPRGKPGTKARERPATRPPGGAWTFTITWLGGAPPGGAPPGGAPPGGERPGGASPGGERPGGAPPGGAPSRGVAPSGGCDHGWETAAYQPTPRLRHLIQVRHATCAFPGCRRPAAQCDADHTLAYGHGGRTCLCNLAPLCRRHHRAKQARGWHLDQPQPGTMTWTTPSGRTYTTHSSTYPG